MQVAPFSNRLADGLAEAQHGPLAKSNESARRVAAQMRQVPCKFKCLAKFKTVANCYFAARKYAVRRATEFDRVAAE
jgi:hypothetical protein